jgi:hypothetical protein
LLTAQGIKAPSPPPPEWIAGFTSGEGCFNINITKSTTNKSGYQVQLKFQLTQPRDSELLKSLVSFLGCGYYYATKGRDCGDFLVVRFSDISSKIIPFFKKYPIQGVKANDFADFCEITELMESKAHLTKDGLEQIKQIKSGLNRGKS